MVEKGKHYYFKGNEYVVVGFTKFKSVANGLWLNGVQYKKATEIDDPEADTYTREAENFAYNFIPALLEVDMEIVAESMSKIVGTYKVVRINENSEAECVKKDGGEVIVISLVVSVNVQPNGELTVIQGGEQATTYLVFMQDMKKRLANNVIISNMVSTCNEAAQRIAKISPSAEVYSLQEAQASLDQTLQIIYTKFGV